MALFIVLSTALKHARLACVARSSYNGRVDKLNNQYIRIVEVYAIVKDAKMRGMAAVVVDDAAHSERLP